MMEAFSGTDSTTNYAQRVDQVVTNEQGVFLLVDGIWFGAEGMQATSTGIFLLENCEWIPLNEAINCASRLWWKCPNSKCGKFNPQNVRYCVYCGRDRFK